jgi:hypothetical protein
MSQAEPSDPTRRYRDWLAALMDAAQLFLQAYNPLTPWQPTVVLDSILALVEDAGVAAERPGDRVRGWRARLLTAAWAAEADRRQATARRHLGLAVSTAMKTARLLAALPDPLDPAHHQLRRELGWALTAVRNLSTELGQLAGARARIREHPTAAPHLPAPTAPPAPAGAPATGSLSMNGPGPDAEAGVPSMGGPGPAVEMGPSPLPASVVVRLIEAGRPVESIGRDARHGRDGWSGGGAAPMR